MKHLAKIQTEFLKEAALFPSQQALDDYLRKHPEADKSNHRVVKKITTKSPNRLKFINFAERRKALDILKKKLGDQAYTVDDDEHQIHFVNYHAIQEAEKLLKAKKLDWAITKKHTN
jgi:hypothetical protein